MKRSVLSIFILSLLFTQFANAQTAQGVLRADEIVNKNIQAMGGREKIMSLSSLLLTGTFATGGAAPINIMVTKKHLIGSRIDIDVNGTNNYQLITPTNAWIYTPVQGDNAPRPILPDQAKAFQVELDLHGPFLNAKEKGIKIELAGKDTVNGSWCYKVKVSSPNGNVTVYSIDNSSNFIVKASTKMFQFGALEEVITTYGDYRQNTDGFWFYYTYTTPRGTTKYENIVANVPVDEERFKIK